MPPRTDLNSPQPQRHHPTHYYFEPGGRPFRSRKNRPCDSCRRTKTRCTIGPEGPPCFECVQTKKNCSFEEGPPARKHRSFVGEKSPDAGGALHALANAAAAASMPVTPSSHREDHDTTGLRSSGSPDAAGGNIHPSPHSVTSLDSAVSESYEPHVLNAILTDDLLPISTGPNHPNAPHARQISTNSQKPVYVVFAPRPDVRTAHDPGVQVLYRVRSLLKALPSRPKEEELLQIFFSRVHPAFPTLPLLKNMGEFPPYLLSAIYATAFSHREDLREMSAAAWSFVHAPNVTEPGLDSPRLSTIAAAILDIGARPTVDPRGNYLTLAKTIAHAQLLGLHVNPTRWSIPSWEKDLRIRLWWGLRIHDAWMSFLNSRPSHVQVHNSDIPLPSAPSLATAIDSASLTRSAEAFSSLCCLSEIVAKLQNEIATIKSQEKSKQDKLYDVADLEEQTSQVALLWRDEISSHAQREPGVQSLLLHILCFRCMLRRIYIETEAGVGGPFQCDQDTLSLLSAAVDYITKLSDGDLDEYWLCYSSHIISSLMSSLIRVCLASLGSDEPKTDTVVSIPPNTTRRLSPRATSQLVDPRYAHAIALHLLSRLTRFLRNARSNGRWDVADPALTRASSVISRLNTWEESTENMNMILALEGQPFPFPPHPMQWQDESVLPPVRHNSSSHNQLPQHYHHPSPQQVDPQQRQSLTGAVSSEVGVTMAPSGPYVYPQTAQLQHHSLSSDSASQHGYTPPVLSNVADHRPPTPPQPMPLMYNEVTGPPTYAAGQTPPDIAAAPGMTELVPDIDMLGMDGVTFWTPWMSNIGLDGNGSIDETLSNYNFGRPAGW